MEKNEKIIKELTALMSYYQVCLAREIDKSTAKARYYEGQYHAYENAVEVVKSGGKNDRV